MPYIIALIAILIDQITKYIVMKTMNLGDSIEIIPNLFYITSHRNKGAAWGILQDKMYFFYLITIVFVIAVVYFIQKQAKGDKLLGISLGLVLGGAIGNFIDRLFRHEVVDFIHVYTFGYDFPVFNIADSSLCIGVILMIIITLMEDKRGVKK
ncbi:signal peptidase II [Bacillus sp. RG28]|uniref:Lipoprotein signal peptidase n=1 Tax=Gottfriedia endophytica TaxID=2820819 RepID=A0A940SJE8_9BACI|nr:signal peptidase II [Gottfriedia endophytica]MBP0724834.1 signal peptidase II [Gottfriedia endophytica]